MAIFFQRHNKFVQYFCFRPTFCFRFHSFWLIIICQDEGPKARRASNAPPSWEYLLGSWRAWYMVYSVLCVRLGGLMCWQAFSVIKSNDFPQGKQVFHSILCSFKTLLASFVYKNDLRQQIEIYRLKEKLFIFFVFSKTGKSRKIAWTILSFRIYFRLSQ